MGKFHIVRAKALTSTLIPILFLSVLLVFPASATSSWSKPRPASTITYDETIGKAESDSIASTEIAVTIGQYSENDPGYGYNDHLSLKISASANTRKGLQYDWFTWSYNWYTVSEPTGITGDDTGVDLTLPFPVLYYGVEYNHVWVCSNGFLSFDSQSTDPVPESIPNTDKPSSTVAAFWRDLNPAAGGSITYGIIDQTPQLFVISWNNIPNKGNGVPQTFQMVIRGRFQTDAYSENDILFQYQSITKDYPAAVGLEDQVGHKGTSYDNNSLYNGLSLKFGCLNAGYRLEELKIKLSKSDGYAMIDFIPNYLGGYNIFLSETTNPYGDFYVSTIAFAAGLALGEVGIIFETLLIMIETAAVLSGNLSEPSLTPHNAGVNENEAWITALTMEEGASLKPFDSTLAATIEWSFTDPNNRDHFLTITSEATYIDINTGEGDTIPTSVTLSMPTNNPPSTPQTPVGVAYGQPNCTYSYSTSTTDPDGDNVRYQFDWGDGTNTTTDWFPSDVTATAYHYWMETGTKYVKARAQDWNTLWSDWSPSLAVAITSGGGGGGGGGPPPRPRGADQ